jgi:steroid 5-alpha reductase family enzyme
VRGFIALAVLLALVVLLDTVASSVPNAGWLVAALTGLLTLGGGWYALRRWQRRQQDVRCVRERVERWCLERPPLVRSASVDGEGPA